MAREGRISHALLFLGQEGSGALPLALAFASYVLCQQKKETDSCSECPACQKTARLIHPDLHVVFPVAKTKEVDENPISDDFIVPWREALLEEPYLTPLQWYEKIGVENKQGAISIHESKSILKKLNLKSFESDFKVMILWLPEKMNSPAANKLLKLLEEPPEKTLFLLVSQDTSAILPTILSRTQLIKVPGIIRKELADFISGTYGIASGPQLDGILDYASGSYLRVKEYFDTQVDDEFYFDFFVQFMRICYRLDIPSLLDWVDEMAQTGREKQKQFLAFSLRMVRGNYMINLGQDHISSLKNNETEFSLKFSRFIHPGNAGSIASELSQAHSHIEYNGNPRIVFFHLGLQMVKLLKT